VKILVITKTSESDFFSKWSRGFDVWEFRQLQIPSFHDIDYFDVVFINSDDTALLLLFREEILRLIGKKPILVSTNERDYSFILQFGADDFILRNASAAELTVRLNLLVRRGAGVRVGGVSGLPGVSGVSGGARVLGVSGGALVSAISPSPAPGSPLRPPGGVPGGVRVHGALPASAGEAASAPTGAAGASGAPQHLSRRIELSDEMVKELAGKEILGDLKFHKNGYDLMLKEQLLGLTYKEFTLLALLIINPEQILTRSEIMSKVWSFTDDSSRVIDVCVRRIRSKLGITYSRYLKTARSVGYLWSTVED
jgi:DNA-binding response OmpR family regulator